MKLEKLFKVISNPQLNKNAFVFSEKGQYPYFTRTVTNNGILGYVEYLDEKHKIPGNSLAVGMLGMQFFYMKSDFYAGQFTKTVFPKFEPFNEKIAMYFISILNKCAKLFLSVLVRDFVSVFNDTEIIVPYKNNTIASEYIEQYVRELEAERVRELEAYLLASGLNDYKLSKAEADILSDMGDKTEFKTVVIGDLFDIYPTKNYGLKNNKLFAKQGTIPVVVNSSFDNGIGGYVTLKATERANTITFSDTTSSDSIFLQDEDFVGYSHVQGMHPKGYEKY